ncbi:MULTISPECIES: FecR family protein [Butyricimonas]|uniref:FecR family protein n=1 Tax=Butyricimonas TaxID=574697 RepID=UPI001D06909B|nr:MULTISPECIES: FecR domain-containing protein [Butyricimonas]MCB6973600.1 FecR domain-containing protein [Butyricimonas synergistica]MCG4520297.1 FecR domain-containing protein [Butyricimonas sp. DFI.6.44]
MMTIEEKRTRIHDYLTGTMDEEKQQAFNHWLKKDEEAQLLFREEVRKFRRVEWAERWEQVNDMQAEKRTMQRIRSRRLQRLQVRYAAAAIVFIAIGITTWWWSTAKQEVRRPVTIPLTSRQMPVLTLNNGEEIILPLGDSTTLRSDEIDIRLTDFGRLEYTNKTNNDKKQIRYNKLTVPYGCEFNVMLSDGSRVWLNAGSSLRYPEVFSGKTREVFLEGEGYFEVERDEQIPFIVQTKEMNVQVLGTSFNIRAYEDDQNVITTLVTGKVIQHYPGIDTSLVLTPSLQAVFNPESGSLSVQKVKVHTVLAWHNGRIAISDARLEDIFKELSRWYDFEVIYSDPSLKDVRFYLHSNRYAEIEGVLKHLQATCGVRFTYVGKTIYVLDKK